jgi:hypothetical protein
MSVVKFASDISGRSAVRLAHMTGGHGVGGSNPLAPNFKMLNKSSYIERLKLWN